MNIFIYNITFLGEDVKDGILSSLAMDPLFPKIKMEMLDSEYPEYPEASSNNNFSFKNNR